MFNLSPLFILHQALNQLFEKIMALDIDERHLLRLGHGEEELETEKDFSRWGEQTTAGERTHTQWWMHLNKQECTCENWDNLNSHVCVEVHSANVYRFIVHWHCNLIKADDTHMHMGTQRQPSCPRTYSVSADTVTELLDTPICEAMDLLYLH